MIRTGAGNTQKIKYCVIFPVKFILITLKNPLNFLYIISKMYNNHKEGNNFFSVLLSPTGGEVREGHRLPQVAPYQKFTFFLEDFRQNILRIFWGVGNSSIISFLIFQINVFVLSVLRPLKSLVDKFDKLRQ